MRKVIIAALAAMLVIGVTPAFAQPEGTWDGTGNGWCPYPIFTSPGDTMFPWQEWKGRFEPDPNGTGYIFYGNWHDQKHNQGTFSGSAILGTPTEIGCNGDWYWLDERVDPAVSRYMGTFTMTLRRDGSYCHGTWITTVLPAVYRGTMEGAWVEP